MPYSAGMISFDEFAKVDIRIGTVVDAAVFEGARVPAYVLSIDFGPELGIKRSSARITDLYQPDDLTGTQVLAVLNLPPRQIGPIRSEVLVLGLPADSGGISLLRSEYPVQNGARVF
jgi:tRNA-binding protein